MRVSRNLLSFQSYRDYHADIFPDTTGLSSAMGPADWFEDKLDAAPAKISLDPKKRPKEVLTVFQVRRPNPCTLALHPSSGSENLISEF